MELAAARGVTVLFDGQGGDELLAGYHPCFDYHWAGLLRRGQWPELGRELVAYRRRYGVPLPYLALRALRPFAPVSVQGMARRWQRGSLGMATNSSKHLRERRYEFVERSADPLHSSLAQLFRYSLPMLLRVADRNSMAHSLEGADALPGLSVGRVRLQGLADVPEDIDQATTKVILRNALQGSLPEVVRRTCWTRWALWRRSECALGARTAWGGSPI